jgi:hypothetical protein
MKAIEFLNTLAFFKVKRQREEERIRQLKSRANG